MKSIVIIILFLFGAISVNAQTWDEWFRQRKTDLKYQHNQIAALLVHLDYVRKGYAMVKQGLNTIHQIREGEFNCMISLLSVCKQ